MENTTEKKLPVRNLERIGEKKFKSYADADIWRKSILSATGSGVPAKVKIFARNDGTFDVVGYDPIKKKEPEKVVAPKEAAPVAEEPKKQHGLTAKERRAKEKRK